MSRRSVRFASLPIPVVLALAARDAVGQQNAALSTAAPEVVARFELAAPVLTVFPFHGTMPVPPGTWVDGAPKPAYYLRDGTGVPVRAQVEIVSRYPRAADGADVIELLARVTHVRRDRTAPDERIQLDVLRGDPAPIADDFEVAPGVAAFVTTPAVATLRAQDVLGNVYAFALDFPAILAGQRNDAVGVEMVRYGHAVMQVRLSGAMRPIASGPTPGSSLPHFPGVHAYVGAMSGEGVVALDLRVHNGLAGHDKANPLDDALLDLHFRSIELVLPAGWKAQAEANDPMLASPSTSAGGDTVVPLVKPNADGTLHFLPRQAQFHRRLVLVPPSGAGPWPGLVAEHVRKESGLGFVQPGVNGQGQELCSWWNSATARYFPQRHVLPSYAHFGAEAIRAAHAGDLNWLIGILLSGAAGGPHPVPSPGLGWAHPWGVTYGGMAGGVEIVFWAGADTVWAASNAGYRYLRLAHRMNSDRQSNVLFHLDGRPTRLEDWVVDGPTFDYVPMNFYMGLSGQSDPFGFDVAPAFQLALVESQGLAPGYQGPLASFESHDLQHLVRYTSIAKALAWIGNDPIAVDDLCMQAELVRLSYHPYANASGGFVQETGLLFDKKEVDAHPGKGFDFGRGEGWGLDTVAAAYSLGTPQWRALVRPWLDEVADLVVKGQSTCSGIVQSTISSKLLEGKFAARQSIEEAIVQNALKSAIESVYRGDDPVRAHQLDAALAASCYGLVTGPSWSPNKHGPWSQLAVGPPTIGAPFCGFLPGQGFTDFIDDYQCWAAFAYGYELTGDSIFLQRASELAGGQLKAELQSTALDNVGNQVAILALVQELGL